jgi:hypothetical protein
MTSFARAGILRAAKVSRAPATPAPCATSRARSPSPGPYAETKEQLGGILILEARDLNHAIQLMSKHPGVKYGPFEIRPAEDMTPYVQESEERRAALAAGGQTEA